MWGWSGELNEDSIMAVEFQRDSLIEPAQNFLYVVADGMGGAEAGEMASAIAVGSMRNYVETKLQSDAPGDDPPVAAGRAGRRESQDTRIPGREYRSAGHGLDRVSVLIVPPEAAVAWVGDSRDIFWRSTTACAS